MNCSFFWYTKFKLVIIIFLVILCIYEPGPFTKVTLNQMLQISWWKITKKLTVLLSEKELNKIGCLAIINVHNDSSSKSRFNSGVLKEQTRLEVVVVTPPFYLFWCYCLRIHVETPWHLITWLSWKVGSTVHLNILHYRLLYIWHLKITASTS